jgi:hypothetical protein
MQMMFLILSLCTVHSLKLDSDLFYDETYHLKKLALSKYRKPNGRPISNLHDYIKSNHDMSYNISITDKGDANTYLSMGFIFGSYNLNLLSHYLNEKNYIFTLEDQNLLFYSYCSDFINCKVKIVFVSRVDFSYYEFNQVGELLPDVVSYSLDFNGNVKYFYLI